ncbi:MAG: hypothetical protein WAK29_00610, partial [Terriglobales bacterium]
MEKVVHTVVQSEISTTLEVPPILLAGDDAARPAVPLKPKKKLIRRDDRDRSQIMRRSFQAAFLLLNVWLGGIFYLWVRQFEAGGAST